MRRPTVLLILFAFLLSSCSNSQAKTEEIDLSQTAEICIQDYFKVYSCNPWPIIDWGFCYPRKVIQLYYSRKVNDTWEDVWILGSDVTRLQGVIGENCSDSIYKYHYNFDFEMREPVGEYSINVIMHDSLTSDPNLVADGDKLPLGVWAEVKLK
jgi:hypothetical protein